MSAAVVALARLPSLGLDFLRTDSSATDERHVGPGYAAEEELAGPLHIPNGSECAQPRCACDAELLATLLDICSLLLQDLQCMSDLQQLHTQLQVMQERDRIFTEELINALGEGPHPLLHHELLSLQLLWVTHTVLLLWPIAFTCA